MSEPHGAQRSVDEREDDRFYYQELDRDVNIPDLLVSVAETNRDPSARYTSLRGVVDEDAGGIVAYAIGTDTAQRLVAALELWAVRADIRELVTYNLPAEEADWDVNGEEAGEGHIVHRLRRIDAALGRVSR